MCLHNDFHLLKRITCIYKYKYGKEIPGNRIIIAEYERVLGNVNVKL